MLRCSELRCGYGDGEVLHGIDLTVEAGEVVMLLGANGAGKTTLLRALSGMLPVKGRIELRGKSIGNLPPHRMVPLGVAHVPQGRGTFKEFTTKENLQLGAASARGKNRKWHERQQEKVFALFPHLADRLNQQASTLSGGEQQMLAIARALMSEPSLLLLDEPSLGLAPQVTAEVFKTLRSLKEDGEMSMLIVEQNAHLSLAIADRVAVLETGRIVLEGDPEQLNADPALRDAYMGGSFL